MRLLVINSGGSSVKYQILEMPAERVMARGKVEGLGRLDSVLSHWSIDKGPVTIKQPMPDHMQALRTVLEVISDGGHSVKGTLSQVSAIAHKIAHGGPRYRHAAVLDDDVIKAVQEYAAVVPVHNLPAIAAVMVFKELLPGVPQVGVFETGFHHTLPAYAYTYGLPHDLCEKYGLIRFGFHGASHRYVSERVPQLLGIRGDHLRIVSCHLGSGTSVAAIDGGISVDISSGFTPQSGTIMSTRPGDFDPHVITFLMRKEGLSVDEIDSLLTRMSGLLGISGKSGDLWEIEQAADSGDPRAKLAYDTFIHNVRRWIGSCIVSLRGVDVIAFTGGIGENSSRAREDICSGLEFLGLRIDPGLNREVREGAFHAQDSEVKAVVVVANEELVVARQAYNLLAG